MQHQHVSTLFTRTICAAFVVATFAACDVDDAEATDEMADASDDEDGDAELELAAAVDPAAAPATQIAYFEIELEGSCNYDDGDSIGTVLLGVYDNGSARGTAWYSWLPDSYPLAAKFDGNGMLRARGVTPLGPCSFYGLVDLDDGYTLGEWTCGEGCSGAWLTFN